MSGAEPLIIVVALATGLVLRRWLGRVRGALATGGLTAAIVWWLVGTLSVAIWGGVIAAVVTLCGGFGLLGLGRGGRSNDGGGFGGGGGGFGGGGASGRW
jgi:uncharacterized protein